MSIPTPAQYTAVGVSAANLVPVIIWLSVWPLQPPDEAQAASIAALILAAGGLIHSVIQSYST
jgi:putative flippase GtrA